LMATYTQFKTVTTLEKRFGTLEAGILTSYMEIINGLNHA